MVQDMEARFALCSVVVFRFLADFSLRFGKVHQLGQVANLVPTLTAEDELWLFTLRARREQDSWHVRSPETRAAKVAYSGEN